MLQQDPERGRTTCAAERGAAPPPPAVAGHSSRVCPRTLPRPLAWTSSILLGAFAIPLYRLAEFAAADSRHSHILLVPLISAYLIWSERAGLKLLRLRPPSVTQALVAFGILMLTGLMLAGPLEQMVSREDWLTLTTAACCAAIAASATWLFGVQGLRILRFPLAFLLFMIPIPAVAMSLLETVLQHGSAIVAHALFKAAGGAVHVEGLIFQLPGITLHVAPECSGIRSTLVLFILSVLAGHFFLRTKIGAVALSLAVLPLALLRNGLRIFTIGELCTHIGPHMIDSPIHRQGGPLFFAISIVPFFLIVVLLMRWEARRLTSQRPAA